MTGHDARYAQALRDPSAVFERPADVLSETGWSLERRREVLVQWRHDARLLSVATAENMTGGEPSQLREVELALARVESLVGDRQPSKPTTGDSNAEM